MELYFLNRKGWRKWLEENHNVIDKIWMVFYKKSTGKPVLSYDDAVEEAICFGWIDGKIMKVNEEYYVRSFTPRRKGSSWSELNIRRAKKQIEEGVMRPEGMLEFRKTIDNPDLININFRDNDAEIPDDLLLALRENLPAMDNFLKFSKSNRRLYLAWLASAKRLETRKSRIIKIVEFSLKNQKPGML
jgi:uncharacterized protein YdeI (YjbR/CyaY-like superfamily)